MFFIAGYILHRMSADIHLSQVLSALSSTPAYTIWGAIGLTVVSLAALSFSEALSVQSVAPGRVPLRTAALTGAMSFAVSNALGFQILSGGSVRYRLYGAAGMDLADIGRIVAVTIITFWLATATVLGLSLAVDPIGVPVIERLTSISDKQVGAIILVAVTIILLWLSTGERVFRFRGWSVPLAGGRNAVLRVVIGAVDIVAAASALYILLPRDIVSGYAEYLAVFIGAMLLGTASHSPGGLGVFEAAVMGGLGATGRADVLASLLAFRVIYYLLPLFAAGLGLLMLELLRGAKQLSLPWRATFSSLGSAVPPLAAGLVLLGGLVLLLSGNVPAAETRLSLLRLIIPLPLAEASHLLASITGVLLLVIAHGLLRRMALARNVAVILLFAGAALSLVKGFDWEEAVVMLALASLLLAFRKSFHRHGKWHEFRPTPIWLALVLIVLMAATWIGFLAFRHVEYHKVLWWEFAWSGDASRFLRSTFAVAVISIAAALEVLINRPPSPALTTSEIPAPVRTILASCSTTQPFVALLGDKLFLLSSNQNAFLMYRVVGRSWISMGDPVGPPLEAYELIWRLAEQADQHGGQTVFYEIGPEMISAYIDLGLVLLKIGEVAKVDLTGFSLEGPSFRDFRYATRRAEKEGLLFEIIPKARVPEIMAELRSVSDTWLNIKKGREKGFSLGFFDERYLAEFDCAVMRKDGAIVAFANLWRGSDNNEISPDLMRYRPGISHVLMDALFARLMLYGKGEGYRWFNLGAAPLAGLASHPLASTWNRIGNFVYRHGDEFYNFEGLRAFKEKFRPVWTPLYIAGPGGLHVPRVLLDVASLISRRREQRLP
jgi:phosphatidylglycerol lysyltransferase